MSRREIDLVAAVRRGDVAAMDELLAAHEQQIYRFGMRMCGNEEDARDVLQETLLAAFRNLGDFRGEARLSTWLYQIARSFCTKLRRPGREVRPSASLDETSAGEVAATTPAPDEHAHSRQIGRALAEALEALSPIYREAIVLRDVEGLSAEEAAEVAGVEVGALKSRLHRARLEVRARLARILDEGAGAEEPPCFELAQEVSAYAGADVDQATCARIEEHLARCPKCSAACDALKRTVSLCRSLPGGDVPLSVKIAVRLALREAIG